MERERARGWLIHHCISIFPEIEKELGMAYSSSLFPMTISRR